MLTRRAFTTLIAGGGDGTLRDIAEAIVRQSSEVSLVLLPLGTANDFARAAGIPLEPEQALDLLDGAVQVRRRLHVHGQVVRAGLGEDGRENERRKAPHGARGDAIYAPSARCRPRSTSMPLSRRSPSTK